MLRKKGHDRGRCQSQEDEYIDVEMEYQVQRFYPTIFGKFIPQEIIEMIVNEVADQSDIYSCCLVNTMWCDAAIFRLWKRVSISHMKHIHLLDRILFEKPHYDNSIGCSSNSKPFTAWMNGIVTPATQQLAHVFRLEHIPFLSQTKRYSQLSVLSRLVDTLDLGSLKPAQSWLQTVHLAKALNRILLSLPKCKSLVLPPIHINQLNRVFVGIDTRLRHLDISRIPAKCYDAVLSALPEYCPNIQSLVFGPHLCFGSTVRESNLQRLGKGIYHLSSIEIRGETDDTGKTRHFHQSTLPYLFKACTNLKRVHLYDLQCPEYRTIAHVLARFNPKLEDLIIRLSSPGATWADQTLLIVAKYCTSMKRIELSPSHAVTSAGLFYLSLRCRKLEWVSIPQSCHTNVSGTISFISNLCFLRHLDLSGFQVIDISFLYQLQRNSALITLEELIMNGVFKLNCTQGLIIPCFYQLVQRFLRLELLEFTVPVAYKSQGTFSCDVPHLKLKHDLIVESSPESDGDCIWCRQSDSVCLHVCMGRQSLTRFRLSPCPIIRVLVM